MAATLIENFFSGLRDSTVFSASFGWTFEELGYSSWSAGRVDFLGTKSPAGEHLQASWKEISIKLLC